MPFISSFNLVGLCPAMPGEASTNRVKLPANVLYKAGTILGELAHSPGTFAAYRPTATDGSQLAKLILEFDCQTDSVGNHSLGSMIDPFGVTKGIVSVDDVPAFFSGSFFTADLVHVGPGSLDVNAVAQLGQLIEGSLFNGILRLK